MGRDRVREERFREPAPHTYPRRGTGPPLNTRKKERKEIAHAQPCSGFALACSGFALCRVEARVKAVERRGKQTRARNNQRCAKLARDGLRPFLSANARLVAPGLRYAELRRFPRGERWVSLLLSTRCTVHVCVRPCSFRVALSLRRGSRGHKCCGAWRKGCDPRPRPGAS